MSDLPASAHDLHHTEAKGQWLQSLDIEATTSTPVPVPSTPLSTQSHGVSTPALPSEIAETEGTATPQRFAPEDHQGSDTVSNRTYEELCK